MPTLSPRKIWLIFAACAVVMLAVMASVSVMTVRLHRAQTEAQAHAELEERVRLALWRMDSMLAPIIAQESARPYFAYHAFHVPARAYGSMFNTLSPGEVLMPSPLLTGISSNVLLHFQFGPDGRLTSPQVPEGNQRDLAETQFTTHERIEASAALLRQFEQLMDQPIRSNLKIVAPNAPLDQPQSPSHAPTNRRNRDILVTSPTSTPAQLGNIAFANAPIQQHLEEWQRQGGQQVFLKQQQSTRSIEELAARAQSVQQAYDVNVRNWNAPSPGSHHPEVQEDVLRPVWFDQTLVLSRRVTVQGREYVQGCWLDWPGIRRSLLEGVADLLPDARLELLPVNESDPQARLLATLPVHLVPGELSGALPPNASPLLFTLALAWVCVLVAGLAVALLMRGTLSLSERRAAFVSAVTHELRTPLTTFKMYSEMLAAGMVPDETRRRDYLNGLCAEATRLNHLVENVLAYAGLERGSARRRIEQLSLRDLVERVKPRLLQRTEQAGMTLQEDADPRVLDTVVQVDVGAVEQILFNLVDNACKYAAPSASEKIIHLEVFPEDGRFALVRIRDHGRGISSEAAKRLFQPFSKTADEAARTAPGVGLGLALCRRLGRSLGGDLRLNRKITGGACFDLLLPLPGS